MDAELKTKFANLWSDDRELQNKAFYDILNETDQPVDWAYQVWGDALNNLNHKDNHNRAIAAQVICNLAKSDTEGRILKDFDALLLVTKDERFVTARHCLQSIWKIGVVGKQQQIIVVDGLAKRFTECVSEKNYTLIRYDILQSLRNVYDQVKDEEIRKKASELMEMEEDSKYRKKYASLWKGK
ncbi:MAG: hypothetical protein CVU39_22460 [Chloroflexi bacterium HGW-Chloroflexi-10]|nr:MAG: hypothetical protein CVU39_22460 [Chloroflexi bacterium HGW-Chloroflexi-10]